MPAIQYQQNPLNQTDSMYGSLLPTDGVDFNAGNKSMSSDAVTGKISGGTLNERREAKGKKPVDVNAIMGAGLGVAGAALDVLDTDDKYGGMDVASSTLKFAAMGAAAGPIGAGVGAVVGLGVGLVQKKKFEEEAKKAETKRRSSLSNEQDQALSKGEVEKFYANQSGATAGAYGVGDVDNFMNKYS